MDCNWNKRTDTVKITSLRKGKQFLAIDGRRYKIKSKSENLVWVENLDTKKQDCFANCATVVPIKKNDIEELKDTVEQAGEEWELAGEITESVDCLRREADQLAAKLGVSLQWDSFLPTVITPTGIPLLWFQFSNNI